MRSDNCYMLIIRVPYTSTLFVWFWFNRIHFYRFIAQTNSCAIWAKIFNGKQTRRKLSNCLVKTFPDLSKNSTYDAVGNLIKFSDVPIIEIRSVFFLVYLKKDFWLRTRMTIDNTSKNFSKTVVTEISLLTEVYGFFLYLFGQIQ